MVAVKQPLKIMNKEQLRKILKEFSEYLEMYGANTKGSEIYIESFIMEEATKYGFIDSVVGSKNTD